MLRLEEGARAGRSSLRASRGPIGLAHGEDSTMANAYGVGDADVTPVRVALVGCGAVARLYYAPAMRELETENVLQVQALFDPDPASAAQLGAVFPSAVRLRSLPELSHLELDLAIIASPPRYHAEQTILALEAGLSVLCEKPMATTVAEGRAMVEAAVRGGRLLAIGLIRRFFPAAETIRQVVAQEILGPVRSVHVDEGGVFHWPVGSALYFRKEVACGGVLLDTGIHVLDLLIWWFGQPVDVRYEDDAMGGLEANCRIHLAFSQGFAGDVRLSRDSTSTNRYVIQCDRGWLAWEVNDADGLQAGFAGGAFALGARLHELRYAGGVPTLGRPASNFHQSFIRQLSNVAAAVQGREQLVVPGEQGLRSLAFIEGCYRDRTLMTLPWLDEKEVARARQLGA
jgi:predicted dehydrogenase